MTTCEIGNLIVAIDVKKHRIRVHKETLHQLNDPKYIQLLFNPELKVLLVRCCTEKEDQAMKIGYNKLFQSANSIEFYSMRLIEKIKDVVDGIEVGKVYRLSGTLKQTKGLAVFPLSTLKEIEHD